MTALEIVDLTLDDNSRSKILKIDTPASSRHGQHARFICETLAQLGAGCPTEPPFYTLDAGKAAHGRGLTHGLQRHLNL